MARLKRLLVPRELHYMLHHTASGLRLAEEDRQYFIDLLSENSRNALLQVHAYCILPQAFHLLVTPTQERSLTAVMQKIGPGYSAYYNKRYQRSGSVWNHRYRAAILPFDLYLSAAGLIESHPVNDGLVDEVAAYHFSSYHFHSGSSQSATWLHPHPTYLALANTPFAREAMYRRNFAPPHPDLAAKIMDAATHNWAMGEPAFLEKIAAYTKRHVEKRLPGRPPKQTLPNRDSKDLL